MLKKSILPLGDSAKLTIDDIAHALASGAVEKLQQSLQKAWHEDTNAVMIIRGCQSYFQQLGLAGYAMRSGQSAQNAIRSLRPPHISNYKNVCNRICGAGNHKQQWTLSTGYKILNYKLNLTG